ncbi:MAG: ABC transporter ATP-binding protein [Sarcina sp.]
MGLLIRAEQLTKEYKKFRKTTLTLEVESVVKAVDEVNLDIYEGDFIAVMGPSGSGKSTLVNLLSTIDTPSSGSVFIEGKKTKQMGESEIAKMRYKTLGFVFQNFNLLDMLTCEENIAVPLTLNNEKEKDIKIKIEEMAQILGIEDLLKKYPSECSGGQQQRIATARALIAGPRIIVADEPTGNLDSTNARRVMNFFNSMNEERDITILMVTHDAMVASYAKKVLYLRDGKIEKVIKRGAKKQRDFFGEVLELVAEDAIF